MLSHMSAKRPGEGVLQCISMSPLRAQISARSVPLEMSSSPACGLHHLWFQGFVGAALIDTLSSNL